MALKAFIALWMLTIACGQDPLPDAPPPPPPPPPAVPLFPPPDTPEVCICLCIRT